MMHRGKRPRPRAAPLMRRTTSMALLEPEETKWRPPAPEHLQNQGGGDVFRPWASTASSSADVFRPWASTASSVLFVPEPTHFLQACALCKRRLVPGKDIYMYRGDAAFCTVECRNEQIFMDEYREKCAEATRKKESASPNNYSFHQQQQNGSNTTQNTLAAA